MNRTQILQLLSQASGEPPLNEDGLEEEPWLVLERFVTLIEENTAPAPKFTDAALSVLAERDRQIHQEGWTPDHDDGLHGRGELAAAAACYAMNAAAILGTPPPRLGTIGALWPWAPSWFKCTTPRRDMVKASALLLAAIELEDRREEVRRSRLSPGQLLHGTVDGLPPGAPRIYADEPPPPFE